MILSDNPFIKDLTAPQVAVVRGLGPYENTRKALEPFDLSLAKNKKVLLKPNVGRVAESDSGVVTNPQVVAAAIDVFTQAGAHVAVGESPITGVKTMEAFEASGIKAVADERSCQLVDLDARPAVPLYLNEGRAIRTIKVCADVLDYDLVVSIPVMKMHMHTGVTLSVKNMKGCLWRRSKVDLHMLGKVEGTSEKSLDVAIADISAFLRPRFAIIDGTIGMEGLGPSAGNPKKLGLVVAGNDPFAADAIACTLMGIDPLDVPHLRLGAQRKYGVINPRAISVTPKDWQSYTNPFAVPPTNLSIEFPNVKVHDSQSCSACQSTLLMFLKRYGEKLFDYFPPDKPVSVAIGKGHDHLPEGTLCIGGCTKAHRENNLYVPGCPPVTSAILKKLESADNESDEN